MMNENIRNFGIELMLEHFNLHFSPNLSFRYGISANYETLPFQDYYQNGTSFWWSTMLNRLINVRDIDNSRNNQGLVLYSVELPVLLHFEFTNSYLTPYAWVGVAPTFRSCSFLSSLSYSEEYLLLGFKSSVGLKAKITPHLNARAEVQLGAAYYSRFQFGVSYHFPLKEK